MLLDRQKYIRILAARKGKYPRIESLRRLTLFGMASLVKLINFRQAIPLPCNNAGDETEQLGPAHSAIRLRDRP